MAQGIADGYYRVHNLKTERYVYVTDNTGSINYQAVTANMGAIELWKDHSRTYSDPASIIYLKNMGQNSGGVYYDLQSQGTGVKQIIDYYVYIHYSGGYYQLYAEGKYLCDNETTNSDDGALGTDRSGNYRKWVANMVDSKTDEWFGITPTIINDGRYLHPFFADFGFSCVPDGMKVWYISAVDKEGIVIKEIKDNVIPARVPVIMECVSSDPSENKLDLIYSYSKGPADNCLKGVYFNNDHRPKSPDSRTEYNKKTMRVLGVMADGRLGYVLSKVTPDKKTKKQYLAANQSYLVVGNDFPEEIPIITESEYQAIIDQRIADSIAAVLPAIPQSDGSVVFTISGRSLGELTPQEIEKLPAGIYIINRKKVVVR